MIILPLFLFLWLARNIRTFLFWLYLWQLKEYHAGRFLDHFRTQKGRKILLHPSSFLKLGLLTLFFSAPELALWGAFALYAAEAALVLRQAWAKKLLQPVYTPKTASLTMVGIVFILGFAGLAAQFQREQLLALLLLFDLLSPIISSVLVLSMQPLSFAARRQVIEQAIRKRRKLSDLKVIGITGSYGKTTTKEILAHILSRKFKVLKTKEHQNSEIAIARTILSSLDEKHEVFVSEMGAYNKKGIALLAKIAKPEIAVLTGANEQHLATFGSMENLLHAEGGEELVQAAPEGALVAVNQDSKTLFPFAKELQSRYERSFRFCSMNQEADVWADQIREERDEVSFRVHAGEEVQEMRSALLGRHTVQNILLAVAVARSLDMSLKEIANALQDAPVDLGAIRLRPGKKVSIIDASYSANPDGVLAGIEYLKTWPGKKILVMPSLIELGSASRKVHREIGRAMAAVCDLAIITTKDRFGDILEGAEDGKSKILYSEDSERILKEIYAVASSTEDAVLLEGGKESRTQRELLSLLVS